VVTPPKQAVFAIFCRFLRSFGASPIPFRNDIVRSNRYPAGWVCGTIEHADGQLVEDCTQGNLEYFLPIETGQVHGISVPVVTDNRQIHFPERPRLPGASYA
jgi:hypothetical protein